MQTFKTQFITGFTFNTTELHWYHCISSINTPGVLLFLLLKSKCFVLNNATVWYYLRVYYYFYTYKQSYVITFLFFDNLAIVLRTTLLFTASNLCIIECISSFALGSYHTNTFSMSYCTCRACTSINN